MPAGADGWAGGSNLTQVAPICWHRMRVAGPGILSAKLSTRTPLRMGVALATVRVIGFWVFVAIQVG